MSTYSTVPGAVLYILYSNSYTRTSTPVSGNIVYIGKRGETYCTYMYAKSEHHIQYEYVMNI